MMNTYNVSSRSLRIFPSSNRSRDSHQYGNNLVTEYNISSLINKLIEPGKDGFLITESIGGLTDPFEFNIKGYFVQTTVGDIVDSINGRGTDGECENFVYFTKSKDDDGKDAVFAHITLHNPKTTTPNDKDKEDDSYTYIEGTDTAEASETDRDTSVKLELFTITEDPDTGGDVYTTCKKSFLRLLAISKYIDDLFSNEIERDGSGVEFTISNDDVITDIVIDDGVC